MQCSVIYHQQMLFPSAGLFLVKTATSELKHMQSSLYHHPLVTLNIIFLFIIFALNKLMEYFYNVFNSTAPSKIMCFIAKVTTVKTRTVMVL